jgi:hypothetical protein
MSNALDLEFDYLVDSIDRNQASSNYVAAGLRVIEPLETSVQPLMRRGRRVEL